MKFDTIWNPWDYLTKGIFYNGVSVSIIITKILSHGIFCIFLSHFYVTITTNNSKQENLQTDLYQNWACTSPWYITNANEKKNLLFIVYVRFSNFFKPKGSKKKYANIWLEIVFMASWICFVYLLPLDVISRKNIWIDCYYHKYITNSKKYKG